MIHYKGFLISKEDNTLGWPGLFRGESSRFEDVTFAATLLDLIEFIDLKWDGKEPEGYFNKY